MVIHNSLLVSARTIGTFLSCRRIIHLGISKRENAFLKIERQQRLLQSSKRVGENVESLQ
jgi:hypothetical protein